MLVASSSHIRAELAWTPRFQDLDTIISRPGGGWSGTRLLNLRRRMQCERWGSTPDGQAVELYTLTNPTGTIAAIATSGGTLVRLVHGTPPADIVLGYDAFGRYIAGRQYFSGIVGRYANRIARRRFTLDGVAHTLARNDGQHSLHGGDTGFNKVVWHAEAAAAASGEALELTCASVDGEEEYPGTLTAVVDRPSGKTTRSALTTRNDGQRYPESPAANQRRSLCTGRRRPDPYRRAPAGSRNAVRLPRHGIDRRSNSRRRQAAAHRRRLRSQFRVECRRWLDAVLRTAHRSERRPDAGGLHHVCGAASIPETSWTARRSAKARAPTGAIKDSASQRSDSRTLRIWLGLSPPC